MRPALERARKALEAELSKVTIADIAVEVSRLGKFALPKRW
jgi:DNA-binding IscR family transcriptional regulator